MRTIALLSKTDRNLVGDEFLDPLAGELLDQRGVNYGIVASQNDDRTGSGYQHVRFHLRDPKAEGTHALPLCGDDGKQSSYWLAHSTQKRHGEAMDVQRG